VSRLVSATQSGRAEWLRLAAFAAVLLACVLVPFALWGDALDRAAPQWLDAQDARLWIAAFGIALLVADVVLPVPSSLVAVMLCVALGPLWGGVCVAAGTWLAFVVGYGLGRLVPEARLRRWVGPVLWDRLRDRASHRALWWISLARPLPVLAEVSALLAGVWRLPAPSVFLHAALTSVALGALYAGSVRLGQQAPGVLLAVVVMLALPAVLWFGHRVLLRRILRAPDPPESSSTASSSTASSSTASPSIASSSTCSSNSGRRAP
jgi:uncharacterized membrane protein YdjX (TVP38/TMEM64 family)